MNIAIVGSRSFRNYPLFKEKLILLLKGLSIQKKDVHHIVSGGASGVDSLAENFAKEFRIKTKIFLPDWDKIDNPSAIIKINSNGNKYNARAGFDRNKTIVDNSDLVIAFWDMKSKGTKDSIEYAKKTNKEVKIIDVSDSSK